jgi:hypothetical protein
MWSRPKTFPTPHIGHSRHGLFFTRWIVWKGLWLTRDSNPGPLELQSALLTTTPFRSFFSTFGSSKNWKPRYAWNFQKALLKDYSQLYICKKLVNLKKNHSGGKIVQWVWKCRRKMCRTSRFAEMYNDSLHKQEFQVHTNFFWQVFSVGKRCKKT